MTIDEARRHLEEMREWIPRGSLSGVVVANVRRTKADAIDTILRALDAAVDWIVGEWQYPGETWEQAKAKVYTSIERDITKAADAAPPPPGGPATPDGGPSL